MSCKDRLASAWLRVADEEVRTHAYRRLVLALYTSSVDWTATHKPCRMGIFDRESPTGPKVVAVFHPNTGQRPSFDIFPFHLLPSLAADTDDPAYRQCAAEVHSLLGGGPNA